MSEEENIKIDKDTQPKYDLNVEYDNLSKEQKGEVQNKIDNFVETLYIAPHLFNKDTIHVLRLREEKLAMWRHNSQFAGGLLFFSGYIYYLIFYKRASFYFRNFCKLVAGTAISGFISGRIGEYYGNKWYYRKILVQFALLYNITNGEIEELHYKINELILKENREEEHKKSTLDNIKFKL